jgi:hypothetical protein
MSILGNIFGAIFGRAQAQQGGTAQSSSAMQGGRSFQRDSSGGRQDERQSGQPQQSRQGHVGPGNIPYAPQAAQRPKIDIEPVLDQLAAQKKQKLDWRHSIVDLLKVVDLDSSLAARKELAQELHYKGDMNNSAEMNIWLHKQVMNKLEENGGKVPESLKH